MLAVLTFSWFSPQQDVEQKSERGSSTCLRAPGANQSNRLEEFKQNISMSNWLNVLFNYSQRSVYMWKFILSIVVWFGVGLCIYLDFHLAS